MARNDPIVNFDTVATGLFGATAIYAAAAFDTTAQWIGALTAISLFGIGIVAFAVALWNAAQRSRYEQVSVAELFFLMGRGIPSDVRISMNSLLVAQFVIGIATAIARPNGPSGSPGSSLAVGTLVPVLGFGLNGLWASRNAQFPPRSDDTRDRTEVSTNSDPKIRQNAEHG